MCLEDQKKKKKEMVEYDHESDIMRANGVCVEE